MSKSSIWLPQGKPGPQGLPGVQGPPGPEGSPGPEGPTSEEFLVYKALLTSQDGAQEIGFQRSIVVKQINTVAEVLSGLEYVLWEFAYAITDKPDLDDYTTWDWAPAFQAAINAPSIIGHTIRCHKGCRLKTPVTVNKSVYFKGVPYDYDKATVFTEDPNLICFTVAAHYVGFADNMVIEGPGTVGTGIGIKVGTGVTNWDMFIMTNSATVFKFDTGVELNTQNWDISSAAGASTCRVGFRLGGLPNVNDRRNGWFHGARLHSCITPIETTQQWQAMGFSGTEFSSCGGGIKGNLVRSAINGNVFFNGSGHDIELTAGQNVAISGNTMNGDTANANSGAAIKIAGSFHTIGLNVISNKGGNGIESTMSTGTIGFNTIVDSDFFDTNTYSGIRLVSGNGVMVEGNVSRTSSGGASRQQYGIRIDAGTGHTAIGNYVQGNKVAGILSATANIIKHNPGHVTDNRGIGTILTANTSVTVAHGLSFTPTTLGFVATLVGTTNVTKVWIANPTATTFDIVCSPAPGTGNQTVNWIYQS